MDFERKSNLEQQRMEEMLEKLTSMSRQLTLLQGFMESKFGSEFATFCQISQQASTSALEGSYVCTDGSSINEDNEEYDKMPNLISQESPSRTLGYVTVPLRQSSAAARQGSSKRDRSNICKSEPFVNSTEDLMYPLHNLTDLLAENTTDVNGTATTPEFMEMELDPSQLLRGEPPALQPIYSGNLGHSDVPGASSNASSSQLFGHSSKRLSRQTGNIFKFDGDMSSESPTPRGSSGGLRKMSLDSTENNHFKKFDCLICGIQFEFAETLKSHMDTHVASRSIRSTSSEVGISDDSDAPPLPRLMPRPAIPISDLKLDMAEVAGEKTRSKKIQSSSAPGSKASALKRRKRYNQSRPCSLECPECGLKIRDKSRLIEHLRGHTGERPFNCSYCDKSYTRKDVLKTHILKMHGDSQQEPNESSSLNIFKPCE